MIGNEEYIVTRKVPYLYSGVGGNDKTLTYVLPTGGCCLQFQCVGVAGTHVTIVGTADGIPSTTEVISVFDTLKIGYSYKKWTVITKFSSDFTTLIIYPASSTGEIISSNVTTTLKIKGKTYIVNPNQFRGLYQEVAGNTYKAYRALEYDKRFTLIPEDKITIYGKQYTVKNVEGTGKHSFQAFLVIER
jgi:hypothetical protein